MARRTKTNRLMGLTGACVLMAASALAAPTIRSVTVAQDDLGERLFLNWNEATAVQIDRFPEARQVVLTLPGAAVASADVRRFDLPANSGIEKARLQEVTLASGQSAVQLTLTLRPGADISPVATPNSLTVLVTSGSSSALMPANATEAKKEIQEPMIVAYGSPEAPLTGAGQASEADAKRSPFFIPEDVGESDRDSSGLLSQSLNRVNEKLQERTRGIDFKDADMWTVLKSFARQTQTNIMANPTHVKGKVSLSLQNVTYGEVLDSLLKTSDLTYTVEPGNIIRIVKRPADEKVDYVTEVVYINWVSAEEVAKVIGPIFGAGESRGGGGGGGAMLSTASAANAVVIRAKAEDIRRMQEMIKKIDAPQKQVKMEVRMVDLTEDASRQLGFRTGIQSAATRPVRSVDGESGLVNSVDQFRTTGGVGNSGTGSGLNLTHLTGAQFLGNRYDLTMQLNALELRNEATVLANPVVMSLDNQPARIEIIRKIPYLSAQQGGDSGVVTVETKDSGIRVDITPRITNNGYVQMEVRPEQLIFRELFAVQSGGVTFTDFPLVDERRVITSVIVKDEETVALGGLRQFESRESNSGAPFLLRVPVLSWLFKNTNSSQVRTELVLFVTPRILKDKMPTTYETALYDKIDYNWDLPDYYYDQVKPRKGPKESDPRAIYGR